MMSFVGKFLSITYHAISYYSSLCLTHTLAIIHLDTYRHTNTRNKSVNKEQTSDCHFKTCNAVRQPEKVYSKAHKLCTRFTKHSIHMEKTTILKYVL